MWTFRVDELPEGARVYAKRRSPMSGETWYRATIVKSDLVWMEHYVRYDNEIRHEWVGFHRARAINILDQLAEI